MPAKSPVSIFWQIIFVVFIPILDLWAFYRIAKLKKYLLYVYLPQIIVEVIFVFTIFKIVSENDLEELESFSDMPGELLLIIPSIIAGLGFTIFSIYLISTWSEKWNKQFQNETWHCKS